MLSVVWGKSTVAWS